MLRRCWVGKTCAALVLSVQAGCVQRTLTVRSDPPGALVYLNDQEVGRTPVTRNFTWYGYYEVELRKEGYQSVRLTAPVIAPWWQWVPIDLAAEALPLRDDQVINFTLRPPAEKNTDPDLLVLRGEQLAMKLESTHVTTRPATRPHHHAKDHATTKPMTQPAR